MSADLAILRTPAEEAIVSRFPAFRARQSQRDDAALVRRRDQAFDVLKARGLPTRRVEEWKYTDLRAALRELPPLAEAVSSEMADIAQRHPAGLDVANATRVPFVNGYNVFQGRADGFDYATLSAGSALAPSLANAVARDRTYADNAAVALNTAFTDDATLMRVPDGTALARPIHLDFRSIGDAPFSTFSRAVLVLEAGASATLIETHDGPDGVAYHPNTLIEIELGDGARLEHVRYDANGDKALALSSVGVRLGAEANYSSVSVTTGSALSRHQVFATYAGEGAQAHIRGAALLRGRQHADSTLVIDHAVPNGMSRETFKSVLDGEARSVFQGKIIVRPDAQKTDGKMMAKALLLSEDAEADFKPELEIFADDVVCGHGATAGALDDELLFYLKTRGIPETEAQALLVQAFVGEVIESVSDETLRNALMDVAARWLKARTP